MQSSTEASIHPGCARFKVKIDVDLYVAAPDRDQAEVYAMKYVRRALSLNFHQGFTPDVPMHPGTMLVKQGRVSIYRPKVEPCGW